MLATFLKMYCCLNAIESVTRFCVADTYTARCARNMIGKALVKCSSLIRDLQDVSFQRQMRALRQFEDPWVELDFDSIRS